MPAEQKLQVIYEPERSLFPLNNFISFLHSIKISLRHTGGSAGLHYPDMTVFTLLPGLAAAKHMFFSIRL
jgi:hypothetical protein